MDKTTELRKDIKETEKKLQELLTDFYNRNGDMCFEIEITQLGMCLSHSDKPILGAPILSLKVTL